MPVTKIQHEIAAILAKNKTPDNYLAGGAAMHFEPNTFRYSQDLDYFHDTEKRVIESFKSDEKTLNENGFVLKIEVQFLGYIRAIISKQGEASKVEWAHDSSWRFLPTIYFADRGYTLHPIDLAINKLLALVGRDEPRDFLDILNADKKILSLGALCWAACGKDPGYNPTMLLELLARKGRYQEEDFNRLNLVEKVSMQEIKIQWREALSQATHLISALPQNELGCLYYDLISKKFVTPDGQGSTEHVQCHFGKSEGILPQFK